MKIKKTIAAILTVSLIWVNAHAQFWNITGNAGTGVSNYLGTPDNVDLKFRTNNITRLIISKAGTVSFGTSIVSTQAKFTTNGAIGNNTAIFGTGASGVSLQQGYPGISFNSYFTGGYKALVAGYGANITLDPNTGMLHFRTLSSAPAPSGAQSYNTPMVITNSGSVGINNTSPAASVNLQIGTSTGARIQIGSQSQLVDMGSMLLDISSTFRPTADNAYHLGGSQNRWVDMWSADGSINTSDLRDKTNIRDIRYGLNEVMKLHPVIFNWKDAPERGDKLGLIAQELQTVIKEAVVSKTYTTEPNGDIQVTENNRLGVYYSDLVPVMVKAIQEQQGAIDARDAEIQSLEEQLKSVKDRLDRMEQTLNSIKTNGGDALADGHLYQNAPNPFSDKSIIRFYLPANAGNGELRIYSSDGKVMKKFRPTARGENKIEIAAGALAPGVYNYTLFIDGKVTASKQMVLIK